MRLEGNSPPQAPVPTYSLAVGVRRALVRQRVALANVIPEVLVLLREEKIGLDCVKAFTLTQDHEVQRQVLAESGERVSAWQIRRMIVSDKVQANDKRVRLGEA